MNDRIDVFLDRMCSRVKYKSMHKELQTEIRTHIEEMAEEYESFGYNHDNAYSIAVSHMGNAFETGEKFNRHYRMPFDSSFGLMIWSAIVTIISYFAYPFICYIYRHPASIHYNSILITLLLLTFGTVNVMYLRRGRLKFAFRDIAHIVIGFLAGWTVSIGILMLTSFITRRGYYPYMTSIEIPFAPVYLPLLPKDQIIFGIEYFCLWFCFITYLIAVKSRRKIKPFTLVAGWFYLEDGKPMEDDEFINGFDKYGRRIKMTALRIMGKSPDKYGEPMKQWRNVKWI